MRTVTDQERFWAGEFGDAYAARNSDEALVRNNVALFTVALKSCGAIANCIEFGANVGLNLRALQAIYPGQQQYAIEINSSAATKLAQVIPKENVVHGSILDFVPKRTFDLVLTKGVLIHIEPDSLSRVYDALHDATGRHLLICEYYNPSPVEVTYRGNARKLFKRDFCGEILDRFDDLRLVDYGFVYRRDPRFPQDDCTWFLMERLG
jgi:pseudaminic acid biosynthesis-associated methylase